MEGTVAEMRLEWSTERRNIADLVPYAHNPRRLSQKQAADLEASLRKFNLAEIPAINTDNTIIAGHMRLAILAKMGRGGQMIDVRVPNRTLTPEEVQELNIRSNKNVGEFDWDILANDFNATDLLNWGFTADDLRLTADMDNLPDDDDGQGALGRKGEVECPECGCKFTPKRGGKG